MPSYPQLSSNLYNVHQKCGYDNQNPVFRGAQNQPHTNINLQNHSSIVSFRATEHIQTKPKKEGLSTGVKWGLGILSLAGSIFACIKLHKPAKIQKTLNSEFKNIENIRKNLSEIFEKNITQKEAEELTKNYKKIYEIKDDDEFVKKLFEQIKNDFGFKNSHIKLNIEDFNPTNAPNWAAMHTDLGHMIRITRVNGKYAKREELFGILFHEFKHHKQFETSIATDKLAFEEALAYKKLKEYSQEQINNNGGEQAVINWIKEQSRKFLLPEYNRIEQEIGQLPKDSVLYKKGLKYIEGKRDYIQESEIISKNNDYKNNILELEAHKVGKLAEELFNWLI